MKKQKFKFTQAGQVVVEYVLLLVVAVALATLITNLIVSRDEESPGFLITKWQQIITFIGDDYVE